MWSSNLVKHFYANVPQDEEKRIIDSNELVRQRLEKLDRKSTRLNSSHDN